MTAHASISTVLGLSWGPWEIAIVIGAILLLFGGLKLPELARSLGKALREFRDELHGQGQEDSSSGGGNADADKRPPSGIDEPPSGTDRDKPADR